MRTCYVIRLDRPLGYGEGIQMQQRAFEMVEEEKADGILLLLQHKPVVTVGRAGGMENLHVSRERLERLGIELHKTNRGGNITYHGPGQLVAYPIFNLKRWEKDVHKFVGMLEEVIIRVLADYGICAGRKSKYPGVWTGNSKIAAIGVGLKHWITMHGFAFNISVDKISFALITPCGITEFGVASLDDFVSPVDFEEVENRIIGRFEEVFEMNTINREEGFLKGDCYSQQAGMA